jgi:mono/diheme cytochrome c family protein
MSAWLSMRGTEGMPVRVSIYDRLLHVFELRKIDTGILPRCGIFHNTEENGMKKTLWISLILGVSLLLAACGGSSAGGETDAEEPAYSAEAIAEGETLYGQTCFACHGADGKGLPNLGKDLTLSEFVSSSSDAELLAYVLEGRTVDDPLNTTGAAMPPKGGFDFLSDNDINSIIAFVRSIQE